MSTVKNLLLSLRKRGLVGTLSLIREKRKKQERIKRCTASASGDALLARRSAWSPIPTSPQTSLVEKAEAMLFDDNYYFTFPYHLKGIDDPWNYDPLEKKYWPKRQYEETQVHGADTPGEVKIVWEINRFKDFPALGVAGLASKDKRYADEAASRMHSWINGNPFGKTVNWSSPLEVAIRGISWGATLRLLDLAGFDIAADESIRRSIWQHASYLNAALSIDKIVRSNHLIGETAGLYILSSLYDLSEAKAFRERAKAIHIEAVLEQTYSDGVSREASGWYHGFVTDFAELVSRTAQSNNDTLPPEFTERLKRMIAYRNAIFATDSGIVKYGDFDNGRAIALPAEWLDVVFGTSPLTSKDRSNFFPEAEHITAKRDKDYLFVRAGEFGWGGNGFSSHAHDDLLSPVVYLDSNPILADAGTYVYNGEPHERDRFRDARSHNNIVIGGSTGAIMKPSFGWRRTRSAADVDSFRDDEHGFTATCSYGEWAHKHSRTFTLDTDGFSVTDTLKLKHNELVEWYFHFHPRWRLERIAEGSYELHDYRDNHYTFELSGGTGELELARYEYSASYMEKSQAQKLVLRQTMPRGEHRYTFAIKRTSR